MGFRKQLKIRKKKSFQLNTNHLLANSPCFIVNKFEQSGGYRAGAQYGGVDGVRALFMKHHHCEQADTTENTTFCHLVGGR